MNIHRMDRMRCLTLLLLIGLAALPGAAQDVVDGFVARTYTAGPRQSMPYRLFIPPSYDKDNPYPLVLWLHGAGGAGSDNLAQIAEDQILGTHTWTRPQNQSKYPTFVLVPQSPTNWVSAGLDRLSPEMLLVLGMLDAVRAEFNIDARRIYVAGQSDGGVGTWNVIMQRPNLFAAAIPLCGGGDPSGAFRIANMPIWAFHGARDAVIPVTESRKLIAAIRKVGGHPRYTEYRNVGHDVWKPAFAEPDLVGWLFAQHR
jgi:predicted peptidase